MDYFSLFKEKGMSGESFLNDIMTATLFHDLHSETMCYVTESKAWYVYDGRRWLKDEGGLAVMERCKEFAQALIKFAETCNKEGETDNGKAFVKYVGGLHSRRRRENLLIDCRSVAPKSLADFDKNRLLFNCRNGTFDLTEMQLRPHSSYDYITKIAKAQYLVGKNCERWEQFISEVMCGCTETSRFLQKAFGYCLSGETSLECFFILYGSTTRNGKSTLSETIAHVLGDYARTVQPQTLARRSNDGASASPDIARLKGARLVNVPEPEKGLELNVALVKQLTGGDTYTGRFLHENPVEFKPDFKIFLNTNHLPQTSDNTVFTSGRVKLIPFDKHFTAEEQDTGLKRLFRQSENMSGILNWLLNGYFLLQREGLSVPDKVQQAISEYKCELDIIGAFLDEKTIVSPNNRMKTSDLYTVYSAWAKENGYRPLSNRSFTGEIRKRCVVRRDGGIGNVIVGLSKKCEPS
jgi:putative DNA primase/helicase